MYWPYRCATDQLCSHWNNKQYRSVLTTANVSFKHIIKNKLAVSLPVSLVFCISVQNFSPSKRGRSKKLKSNLASSCMKKFTPAYVFWCPFLLLQLLHAIRNDLISWILWPSDMFLIALSFSGFIEFTPCVCTDSVLSNRKGKCLIMYFVAFYLFIVLSICTHSC